MQDYNMTDRVRQEVAIHARLKHTSILELYTFFEDNSYVYLVLELAHNGPLHQYLSERQKTLSEIDAANVISQVVNGLIYLQSSNIMHRDISMSNLLLTSTMQVKISDFGLATQLNKFSESKHMTLCGTPNFISPEVASRSAHGLKTDNWSLGCLFYTLLVGRPPFDKNGVKSTLTQVVIGDYSIPNHISAEAQDLIKCLLCKDQSKRIELHQVVTHPFMLKCNQHNNLLAYDSGIATFSSTTSSSQQHSNNNNHHNNHSRNFKSRSMEVLNKYPVEQQQQQQHQQLLIGSASMYRSMSINKISSIHSHHSTAQMNAPLSSLMAVDLQPSIVKTMSVQPLSTIRLQPTRHKMKNVVLSILAEPAGEVSIEFLKYKSKHQEERVYDVCRISSDGLRIVLYQPNKGRGIRIKDTPPELPCDGADQIYSYENLPEKHWKKYMYAHRFIQMVRAKTPKVTFYSEQAKCQLMESLEDYEMILYKGGTITKKNSNDFQLDANVNERTFILQHAEKCYQHCVRIENTLARMSTDNPCFPVIIGRRPVERNDQATAKREILHDNTFNNYISSSQTPLRTPKITMPSFSMEQSPLSCVKSSIHNFRYPETPPQTPQIHHKQISNVGNVALLPDGTFEILYNDGSKIIVLTHEQGSGILYSASSINKMLPPIRYNENEMMPDTVRAKFNQLPMILNKFKNQDANINFITSTPTSSTSSFVNPMFSTNRLNNMKFMR
jgi:polo-like kinase 4